jgi:hypothetical protein
MKRALEKKMEKLQKMFPNVWFKDGAEFYDDESKNFIWTGEGSYIDGHSVFDLYTYVNTMGVHPEFDKALNELGLWAEFYDGGTVFIYQD